MKEVLAIRTRAFIGRFLEDSDLPELDPRNVELSCDRVVVWYSSDDEDCAPSHGEWLSKHFRAKTRVFEGYGHIGGAVIDHPEFIKELVGGRNSRGNELRSRWDLNCSSCDLI